MALAAFLASTSALASNRASLARPATNGAISGVLIEGMRHDLDGLLVIIIILIIRIFLEQRRITGVDVPQRRLYRINGLDVIDIFLVVPRREGVLLLMIIDLRRLQP